VPIAVSAPEPCTWHELVAALDSAYGASLRGMRAAVQEYGESNPDLLAALTERGVECTPVPVYHWSLPENVEPLRNAIRSIIAGQIHVIVFLTAVQVTHLVHIAQQMDVKGDLLKAMRRTVILSIGPSTTEELAGIGIRPDYEPSHPKMGILIHEAAQRAANLLLSKRTS
jgi:uroporphyrinogen-III synthase